MRDNSISAEGTLKGVSFVILKSMSNMEPSIENVVYLDEYPELQKRLWLRRLARERLSHVAVGNTTIIPFERPEPPDSAA